MLGKMSAALSLIMALLMTAGCSYFYEQQAILVAKADLRREAKETGREITNIQVDDGQTSFWDPPPAEKAGGLQAVGYVALQWAHRCPGEQWANGRAMMVYQKASGKWVKHSFPAGASMGWIREEICNLHRPPKDWQEIQENRKLLEKYDFVYSPFVQGDQQSALANELLSSRYFWTPKIAALVGPTWMFVPARKGEVERWLDRKFTDAEFLKFRDDPQQQQKMIALIESSSSQWITPRVVEFYRQALTYEGRMNMLQSWEQNGYFETDPKPTPQPTITPTGR